MRNGMDIADHQARELVADLNAKGVDLWMHGGKLHYKSAKGKVSQQDVELLRRLKEEVSKLLDQSMMHRPDLPAKMSDMAPMPLTSLQRQLWRDPAKSEISNCLCVSTTQIVGELNAGLLKLSIEHVVHRHDALRTSFLVIDGVQCQIVNPDAIFEFEVIDCSAGGEASALERSREVAQGRYDQPMDICGRKLVSFILFEIARDNHIFISFISHMICDGISKNIVNKEIWSIYDKLHRGDRSVLAPVAQQFSEYVAWQQSFWELHGDRISQYWNRRLNEQPPLRLPRWGKRGTVRRSDVISRRFTVGAMIVERINQLSRHLRIGVPIIFFSIYLIVMSSWCSQRDIVVKFSSDGRFRLELLNTVGFVTTILQLRINLSIDETFLDLVRKANDELTAAIENHDLDHAPFIVKDLGFDLNYNWTPDHVGWSAVTGEHADRVDRRLRLIDYLPVFPAPFAMYFSGNANSIVINFWHLPEFISSATVESLAGDLCFVAEKMSSQPRTKIGDLVVIPTKEWAAAAQSAASTVG